MVHRQTKEHVQHKIQQQQQKHLIPSIFTPTTLPHLTRPRVMSTLHYYLVNHPTITNYQWTPNQTPGSSPLFLTITILTYLTLTFTFPRANLPPINPTLLRFISTIHNLVLLIMSLTMAVGCTLATLSQMHDMRWIFCFPDPTHARGSVFFWAHVFYFSKLYEFIDTLLIILSGSNRRLSFLHVYHHCTVVVMCYVWLSSAQSLLPIALVTNASVHVLMYAYYLLCALGYRPWWKVLVTNCQIVQFVFSFLVSSIMLFYHFSSEGSGCSGFLGWCFNAVFNASLLVLFVNFHFMNYDKKSSEKRE